MSRAKNQLNFLHTTLLLSIISCWILHCSGYTWPSPQYDALEMFLFEGRRSDGSNMASLQHPCKRRSDTGASVGAEWVRLAYHDVATHDSGSGGLDASIVFELDRAENLGHGMNASLADFQSFSNKYLSRSDIIAAATTFAVTSCGGPIIPFRGGRIDALTAGPYGVPQPQQDLQAHTESFRKQGFGESEMITLVACGHTLGGVRSTDFPGIVSPMSDDGSGEEEKPTFGEFDSSDAYDNLVVQYYLDGSTKNPLIVNPNRNLTSDFRIFSSDNNVTVRSLSDSDAYMNSCRAVLEKMLNTVPSNVTLTDEITLLHEKVSNARLTLERGELIFKASLRLTQPINTTPNRTRTVQLLWCDRYGETKDCSTSQANVAISATHSQDPPDISPITQRLGFYFLNYQFVVKIDPEKSISLFWFEVRDDDRSEEVRVIDNGGGGYWLDQDRVLYVPMMSALDFVGSDETSKVYHIVAAVRNDTTPSRVYVTGFDSAMPNYGPILDVTKDMTLNSTLTPIRGYNFYTTSLSSVGLQLTVDMHAVVDDTIYSVDFQQTYFLGPGTTYTPPTESNVTTTSRLPGNSNTNSAFPGVYVSWFYLINCILFLCVVILC